MTWEVNGWYKISEEDSYEQGCFGPGNDDSGSDSFSGDTLDELFESILEFLCMDTTPEAMRDTIEINSCGEPGRVDISRMEDAQGYEATKHDLELWKQGEKRLWYCTYIFGVQHVDRKVEELQWDPFAAVVTLWDPIPDTIDEFQATDQ